MTITAAVRLLVRQRANYACECCGVREQDAGGELTIDHFRPVSRGGNDDPGNLVYCCHRCNEYKGDYWDDQALPWNPRLEPRERHLLTLGTGVVHPSSTTGKSPSPCSDSTARPLSPTASSYKPMRTGNRQCDPYKRAWRAWNF